MARPEIERFPDLAAAASAAAGRIAGALAGDRPASLVVTGGRTPGPIYDRLAAAPVDWSRVWVTLSDERWVDEASPASNARLVRERLLVGPAARARFTPLMGGEATPEAGAAAAEARLRAMPRPFDMVLLGMGEDGHVASLFPGGALAAGEALCMAVPVGGAEPRISLTMRALLDSRQVLVFATGEAKWAVLQAALGGADLPVTAVLNGPVPVTVAWCP
jgi:6-phosphogluconolactonase